MIGLPFASFIVVMLSMSMTLPIDAMPSDSSSNMATISLPLGNDQQPSEDNNTITARVGDPFQLRINQTAIIMTDNIMTVNLMTDNMMRNNITIKFLDVSEDSRCPASVVCIWPGQITISLNVTESFRPPRLLNLTLGPLSSNSSALTHSHIIELLQVEPYPMSDGQVPIGDYRANLTVLPPPPIPTGEWNIVSNGLHGTLNITSIDMQGRLKGTILLYPFDASPTEINGYIDGDSGKVGFVRNVGPDPLDIEVYIGYVFTNIIANCLDGIGPGSCHDQAQMAGTFESFYIDGNNNDTSTLNGILEDSKRSTFGWFASHIPHACPPACPG
jgi:hypothetical protein